MTTIRRDAHPLLLKRGRHVGCGGKDGEEAHGRWGQPNTFRDNVPRRLTPYYHAGVFKTHSKRASGGLDLGQGGAEHLCGEDVPELLPAGHSRIDSPCKACEHAVQAWLGRVGVSGRRLGTKGEAITFPTLLMGAAPSTDPLGEDR